MAVYVHPRAPFGGRGLSLGLRHLGFGGLWIDGGDPPCGKLQDWVVSPRKTSYGMILQCSFEY